jgi:hypothetical protein
MIGWFVLALANAALAMPCEKNVSAPPTTFEKINLTISASPRGYVQITRSAKDFTLFWNEAWPYLKNRAAEADVSVKDLVAEQLELLDLIRTTNESFNPSVLKVQRQAMDRWLNSIERLEKIPLDKKMKSPQWDIVRSVAEALSTVGLMAVHLEETYLDFPTIDPFGKLDVKFIERVFDSLDHSSLDRAAKMIELERQRKEYYAIMKLLVKEREALEALSKSGENEEVVEEQAAVLEEPAVEASDFALNDELAVVLRDELPLESGKIYHATTPRGENLTVTLSESIVKDARNGEDKNIRRLLKSIFLGTGYRSGLKTLYEIGHGIIELKVIGNAHRRLIGCLEGRHVRLLSLKRMGDKGTQYFRQIPANLCKQ